LIFVHDGSSSSASPTSFAVTLGDEDPAHPASDTLVTLNVCRPNYPDATMQVAATLAASPSLSTPLAGLSSDEQQMTLNYFLSRDQGYVIWDSSRSAGPEQITVTSSGLTQAQYAQYVASYGHDRKHVLAGGVVHARPTPAGRTAGSVTGRTSWPRTRGSSSRP